MWAFISFMYFTIRFDNMEINRIFANKPKKGNSCQLYDVLSGIASHR